MYLTFAQAKYAHKKLTGTKIEDATFHEQANAMFRVYGEAKIREAIADYDSEKYVNGLYDC